jgi:hypothetical protein
VEIVVAAERDTGRPYPETTAGLIPRPATRWDRVRCPRNPAHTSLILEELPKMRNRTTFTEHRVPAVTRELDARTSDGIEVRLLWNPRTDQALVSVADRCRGEAFQFEVAAKDALQAFHHPYAFAPDQYNVVLAA